MQQTEARRRLLESSELAALARSVSQSRAVIASGLWGSSVALVMAALRTETDRPVALVCGHLDEADDLADDVAFFCDARPEVLPAVDTAGGLGRASEEQVADRLRLVTRLTGMASHADHASTKSSTPGKRQPDLIIPIQALMQSVPDRDELKWLLYTISAGQMLEPEKLIVWLADHGYNRLEQVEVPGDFAVRGGIVDVYIPGDIPGSDQVGLPIRIDFFGDQVESIRSFDLETLGSGDRLQEITLYDIAGRSPTTSTSLLHLLDPSTILIWWQPLEIAEQGKSYLERVPDQRGMYPLAALLRAAERFSIVELSPFDQGKASLITSIEDPTSIALPIRSVQKFETDIKKSIVELRDAQQSTDITIVCESEAEQNRLEELLDQHAPGLKLKLSLERGFLHRGFVWEGSEQSRNRASATRAMLILPHHELFHRFDVRRRMKKTVAARAIDSFLDLQVGDYVVHIAHGIAKFTGIHVAEKDGHSEEYLTLRFADSSMHVPVSRINLIQKYVGGFNGHPQLSKVGSGSWEKQKEKVSEAVMDMAAELLEVQAARRGTPGIAYPADTTWQTEFEAEFPYTPTPDQASGAEEIKRDMQQPRPMDRLLCGDVGYGKTELAMRAAFKAVEHGKQVAVLVPTTVLAEQHERSFRNRFADYPFAIESISRFKTGKEAKNLLSQLGRGEIDIIIGTHRLLSQDIKFADLGLVVIDEEQRFGVTHKERLKQFRATVDVLTMSATPIPRTLHMGMVGLRDITSLTTPPQDRRAIVTEVCAYDENRVKLAVQRELAREGQVYYVHNRIEDIYEVATKINAMVPDARIVVGHGQMSEDELEDVMLRFIRHDADILVSTTIIESGLDIPNANTMLIDHADQFGLSQLHQLRGRVGRYKHRAYCYLLLPPDRPITPIAAKRLKAIEEYSHLGAGFKIAMRDLEIRGAGNILGPEQSGHIASVGYELYCQLLDEAVHQLKTGSKPTRPEAHIEIGISSHIPRTYIASDKQRMELYRRISRCTSIEEIQALIADMTDAFGEAPRQVTVLTALTELRLLSSHFGIESIVKKDPDLVLKVIDAHKAGFCLTGAPGRLTVVSDREVYLRMPPTFMESEAALLTLRNLMRKAYDREKNPGSSPGPAPAAVHATPAPAPKPNEKKTSSASIQRPSKSPFSSR